VTARTDHVNLPVPPGRSGEVARFYVDVLGFGLASRPDTGRPGAWLDVGDGTQVHLSEREGAVHPDQHVAFIVDGIAGIRQRAGGDADWTDRGEWRAVLRDPAGNLVELFDDRGAVTALLGRAPQAHFEVAARHGDGSPLVIRNAPLLDDGTPMPTRWWLVGEPERTWIGRLESTGGVDRAEAEVDAGELAAAHARYAAERDASLPPGWPGPAPYGGVGGTRVGVKCLHAHYAWWLVGGDDPVGRWIDAHLDEVR
jgi:hypothetical protein